MPQGSHTRDCLVNPVTGRAVKRGTPTFKRIMQYKRGEMTLEELTNILRSKARKSKGAEEIIPADPIERFNYYEKKWKEAIAISAELEEKHGEQSKRYQAAEREVDRLAALRRKARQEAQPARARAQAQEARARASPAAREEPEEKKEPEKKPEKEKQLEAMRKAMQTARERAEKKKDDSFEREKRAKRARMKEARKKKTTEGGNQDQKNLIFWKAVYDLILKMERLNPESKADLRRVVEATDQMNKFIIDSKNHTADRVVYFNKQLVKHPSYFLLSLLKLQAMVNLDIEAKKARKDCGKECRNYIMTLFKFYFALDVVPFTYKIHVAKNRRFPMSLNRIRYLVAMGYYRYLYLEVSKEAAREFKSFAGYSFTSDDVYLWDRFEKEKQEPSKWTEEEDDAEVVKNRFGAIIPKKQKIAKLISRKERCLDAYEGAKATYGRFLELVKEHRREGGKKEDLIGIIHNFNYYEREANWVWEHKPGKYPEEDGYYDCEKELEELKKIRGDIVRNRIWKEIGADVTDDKNSREIVLWN